MWHYFDTVVTGPVRAREGEFQIGGIIRISKSSHQNTGSVFPVHPRSLVIKWLVTVIVFWEWTAVYAFVLAQARKKVPATNYMALQYSRNDLLVPSRLSRSSLTHYPWHPKYGHPTSLYLSRPLETLMNELASTIADRCAWFPWFARERRNRWLVIYHFGTPVTCRAWVDLYPRILVTNPEKVENMHPTKRRPWATTSCSTKP